MKGFFVSLGALFEKHGAAQTGILTNNSHFKETRSFEYLNFPAKVFSVLPGLYTIRVVVAEWLRRWTRNPLGSPRAGSNPADYVEGIIFIFSITYFYDDDRK